jgi:3-oxoacyl-[acyl-carrier protein] reductase
MRVKDKVAVVTGGGRGIGKAISMTLAHEGADVAIFGRTLDVAEQTASEIRALGRKSMAIQVNVAESSQVNQAVQKVLDEFGRIDILVNNAAGGRTPATMIGSTGSVHKDLLSLTDEQWDDQIAVDFTGPFYCMRAVLKNMVERRYGKIITIGSLAGQTGRAFPTAAYCASKAGIEGLSRSAAISMAKYGININVVNPGPTDTERFAAIPEEEKQAMYDGIPYKRGGKDKTAGGKPQDIANAVLFLVSDESEWITGICLNVVGGQLMKS